MSTVAVIGTQWGDEGKGKVVDILSESADYIVRFQGGNNAGHTVVIDGSKYVFHLLPSGILHDDKRCILGNGMVIDLEALSNEVDFVEKIGKGVDGRLFISERAHLIFPYHKELDAAAERRKGTSIGTTLKGIGPAYRDKAGRVGIRVADLEDIETFRHRLKENVEEKRLILKHVYGWEPDFDFERIFTSTLRIYERLRDYVCDTVSLLNREIDAGRRILFEGAQATLLDIDVGTYPFVTSSNASALGITTGAGVSPKKVKKIFGISKAYTTRVGGGPFPTELKDQMGELLRARGHEFGATTGRPRRCGWLDLFAVRFSKEVNDLDGIILTKLDVLDDFEKVNVCVGYTYEGEMIESFPSTYSMLSRVKPVYETLDGWRVKTTGIRSFDELPAEAKRFVEFIEDYLSIPVVMISMGPQRDEIIVRENLW